MLAAGMPVVLAVEPIKMMDAPSLSRSSRLLLHRPESWNAIELESLKRTSRRVQRCLRLRKEGYAHELTAQNILLNMATMRDKSCLARSRQFVASCRPN